MRIKSKNQILKIIEKKGQISANQLSHSLKITPQALHRHLRELLQRGLIGKIGSPPKTTYCLGAPGSAVWAEHKSLLQEIGEILGAHPAIRLVCLFGSYARGEQTPNSDIDVLVWIADKESFTRQDLWAYWDRQARHLKYRDRVSLIVRRLKPTLTLHTLLLDMPEEHLKLYDAKDYFDRLRNAVIYWRKINHSKKVPTFGGKHYWLYSTRTKSLDQINFELEIGDVP